MMVKISAVSWVFYAFGAYLIGSAVLTIFQIQTPLLNLLVLGYFVVWLISNVAGTNNALGWALVILAACVAGASMIFFIAKTVKMIRKIRKNREI
jgi:hypothetical protein